MRHCRAAVVVLSLCILAALPSRSFSQPAENLFQKKRTVQISQIQETISLQDSFLVVGSDSLFLNNRLLQRETEYKIDYAAAVIILENDSTTLGQTLKISYTRLPLPTPRRFQNRKIEPVRTDTTQALENLLRTINLDDRFRDEAHPRYVSDLKRSGSLTRGVSVGSNQNLRVDSGLRLQLSGNITEDIAVTAALTDQNTPIQPEGNTQTLREIDQVFINLKGRHFDATMGDYELTFSGTEFAGFRRKLQGAAINVEQGAAKISIFGAVSRGRFHTMELLGVEGNQGPYQLTGDKGQVDIIILAGTERVWIDGEPMIRGENNDYVIEYGNGQMTFTRNRLITGDSRITIDFQFSDEKFQRTLFGSEANIRTFGDKLKIRTTLLRESDDKNNPLGLPLTDELLETLSGAGDSLAFVDGALFVGENQGSYLLQDSIFVFVGRGNGDYRVRFSDFGDGNGDYRYSGFGNYDFVGEGAGRYRPFVILPKAQRNELADFRIDASPLPGLTLRSEIAVSGFDNNLYSGLNDDDNRGGASFWELNYAPEKLRFLGRNLGKGSLRLKHRRRGERYQDIDRADVIEFGRRWDIQDVTAGLGESISEAELRFEPWNEMQFYGTLGALQQDAADVNSDRWEIGANWRRPDLLNLNYRIENIARKTRTLSSGDSWMRQKGALNRRLGFIRPIFQIEQETKKDARFDTLRTGFRFGDYTGGFALEKWQNARFEAKYSIRRDDDRIGEVFQQASEARTQSYAFSIQRWKNIQASANYVHRERDYTDSLRQNTRTDLAEIRLGWHGWRRAVRLDARYQISNSQVNQQEEVFFRVREGEGNYIFSDDLNEYVQRPFGDFIRRLVPTDEFIPVSDLRSRLQLRVKPETALKNKKTLSGIQKLLMPLSGETLVRVEEKTRDPDVRDIYFFNLSRYQNQEFSLLGNLSLRQDFHLYQSRRDFSLRYRLVTAKSLNNQFLEGGQRRREIRHELRLNRTLAKNVAGQFELIQRREDRTFSIPGRFDRFVRGLRFESDFSYRPRPRFELALRSIFGRDRDEAPDPATTVRQITLKPRAVYSLSGKGVLRSEIEYTSVTADAAPGQPIPFELAQGNRAGDTFRWNFSFNYRLSQNLNASITYQGRNEPDRPRTIHIAKAEVRAFF